MKQETMTGGRLYGPWPDDRYWVTRVPGDEAMRRPAWSLPTPAWTDGAEGEWTLQATMVVNTVVDWAELPESQRPRDEFARRDRPISMWDRLHPGAERKVKESDGLERAGFGERDREFRNLDLRAVQWEADEWDVVLSPSGHARVSEFHDLVAHMGEIPFETKARMRWNQERTESGHWEPAFWTQQSLAVRLCKYRFNESYFSGSYRDKRTGKLVTPERPRVPEHAWCGTVHEGEFIRMGDAEYCVVIAKWRKHGDQDWSFTVFWRESVGWKTEPNGRRVRDWVYHYAKTFTTLEAPSYTVRQGALAFALRLEAKAKLEADLQRDLLISMGEAVEREWDHTEYTYDPVVLTSMADASWSDEY